MDNKNSKLVRNILIRGFLFVSPVLADDKTRFENPLPIVPIERGKTDPFPPLYYFRRKDEIDAEAYLRGTSTDVMGYDPSKARTDLKKSTLPSSVRREKSRLQRAASRFYDHKVNTEFKI